MFSVATSLSAQHALFLAGLAAATPLLQHLVSRVIAWQPYARTYNDPARSFSSIPG